MALRIRDEHPGQGARFHGHLGETWSFRPRVFLVNIPLGEFRFGDADAGVLRLTIFVPAAGHVFGDRMLIHLLRFELAAREHTARQQAILGIEAGVVEHTPGKEIGRSGAQLRIVQVIGGDRQHVGYERSVDPPPDLLQARDDVVHLIHGWDVRRTPGRGRHGHGHPSAEDGRDGRRLGLLVNRFQVVSHGQEVQVGGKAEGGVSPVGVGEWAELPTFDEPLQAAAGLPSGMLPWAGLSAPPRRPQSRGPSGGRTREYASGGIARLRPCCGPAVRGPEAGCRTQTPDTTPRHGCAT